MRPTAAFASTVLLAAALVWPSRAQACWDGYAGSAPRASLCMLGGSMTWTPARARELADWLVRVEALVPPGHVATACEFTIDVCKAGSSSSCVGGERWERQTYWGFFRTVARLVKAKPAVVRAALQKQATPFTVQVAVGYDAAGARALARRLNRTPPAEHGFYEAGGFPAQNDAVHVIADRDDEGAPIYRVVVGAYLTRAEARATAAKLRTAAGLRSFVRPL